MTSRYSAGGNRTVEGPVADDAAQSGNPIPLGGLIDDSAPNTGDEGDVKLVRVSPEGNLLVEVYAANEAMISADVNLTSGDGHTPGRGVAVSAIGFVTNPSSGAKDRVRGVGSSVGLGLGVLAASPRTPGASEVKALYDETGSTSTTAEQILDPTSGKKIRIISVSYFTDSTQIHAMELYFGNGDTPGANVSTNSTRAILVSIHDRGSYETAFGYWSWPDGAGPIAVAANDSLYIRTDTDIGAAGHVVVHYREE
jgi:hypothetical protein